MTKKSPADDGVPCPGCGGRGRFDWPANPKVPRGWGNAAPCRMCRGTGKIPAQWLKKSGR
jgi:DnaJ-class molecular chaperone